ncbi:MAG: hypothetical protein QM785_14520 [Pyrinomonadaceae bacterium]
MSKTVFLAICLAIALFVMPAAAQTTIFNIPSAETQSRGSWGLEADFIAKPVSYRDGGYQTYGYRVAYGAGNKTEIGTNFYLTKSYGETTGQVEFSVKQNIYRNEKLGVSVSGGTVVFVPVKVQNGDKTAIMVYGNASKSIEPLNGLTLTGGVYHVFRGNNFGTKTGVMAAAVQPIAKKFSFVADWYSGKNRLGYSSAGINYQISTRQYILSGYSFGNSGRGNNAFAAYYGVTF